ncbi:unnamed protein product [Lepidochelys kempii]
MMAGNDRGEAPLITSVAPPSPTPLPNPQGPLPTTAAKPPATAPAGASAAGGTGATITAAMPTAHPDSRKPPPVSQKGQGVKKGKGPATTNKPSMAEAAPTAMASSLTMASLPAVPSTSSASVPPLAPKVYAQVGQPPPPAASSSRPPTTSATINNVRGPFPTMTRKHGVRCLLVPASHHVETYVQALARVVGPMAIVAASKMYGKVVFFLASEAATQEAVEKGLAVGGVFVPLEPLEDLSVRLVLTSVPPFLPNAALLPTLSTLGKPISIISPLPLGCKDPTLRHILSFRRQVQLLPPPAARDGEALEGSFLVPYQGARYRVYYSTGESQCYLCRSAGHVRRDCPLTWWGGAPKTPETRQDIGSVIADAPGRLRSATTSPPARPTTAPAQAQETPPLQCPDERGSPALAVNNPAEPMEQGAAKILPGIGEGLPQGEPALCHVASPLPPRAHEPLPMPPNTTSANQPPDDAMEGWSLVQGKRGKRKARAPLHPSNAEAPRKTRKGGTDTEPSLCPRARSICRCQEGKTK